jgi:hypothetical protein
MAKQEYDVTVMATVARTITVYAWDVSEAEDRATEIFDAGIKGDYEVSDVEIVEVNGSCDD